MSFPPLLQRLLPFLRWLPYGGATLRADFLAGLTVALVLVPQSMAYAQLAGMPAYYGLYAAFLPVMVAALWGSSNQLGTGPVAVASLLTASSLTPLAAPGSDAFVALAIMLALLVGVIQLVLGVFKLGVVVNFLSHPVIVGFTNAAAIIIALSQVNKLIGVPMGRSEHFIEDIWGVAKLVGDTHLPTLAMGGDGHRHHVGDPQEGAQAARRADCRGGDDDRILADRLRAERHRDHRAGRRAEAKACSPSSSAPSRGSRKSSDQIVAKAAELKTLRKTRGELSHEVVTLNYEVDLLRLQLKDREDENRRRNRAMRSFVFERSPVRRRAGGVPRRGQGAGRRARATAIAGASPVPPRAA
jgi:SulP family sulfate permease